MKEICVNERTTVEASRQQIDFGAAIRALKEGRRVTRTGWNGKGMWLALVLPNGPESINKANWGLLYPIEVMGESSRSKWPRTSSGKPLVLKPWIGLKTADDGFVPWLASQAAVLAEDWEVLEEMS